MKLSWVLRGAAVLILAVLAFKPVVIRPDSGLATDWAVLLDSSRSMRVKDPAPRLDDAKEIATRLSKKVSNLQFFSFSDKVQPVVSKDLGALEPAGRKSDIGEALKKVFSEKNYRGGVLLTDGRHVGPTDPVSEAATAGKPLLLVGFGDPSLFKDIAVRSIQGPPFAFKNVATSLSATLSVVGYQNQKITVKLRNGDNIIGLQTVQVSGSDVETSVTFSWTPTTLGSKVLTVEADAYAGEITTVNNRKDLTLDVGRDRFRVLYICGEPGYEYSFLRHQFKSDPAVELVTFVILRNASNVVSVAESELSLIPFPTQDVLINQIATFDLVVFEEFAYHIYGLMPTVLHAIRKKVEDGGSFLLMGGQTVFGPGSDYAVPGIAEMIPVEFGSPQVRTVQDMVMFRPKALSHPILRLEESAQRNEDIWKALPPVDGLTLLPGVKPGATVLGTAEVGGREYPLLTVWKHGKGRVAALATRTTWRWSMASSKKGQTSYAYQQFWKNMVLWLTHSDEFKSVRMAFESRDVRLGETESLRVWVYDEYFKPIPDADVRIEVTHPDGHQETLTTHPETTGVYLAPFNGAQLGPHRAQAWVLRNGKKFGQDTLSFRVVESHSEEEDLRPNFALLKEMAQATGGKFIQGSDFTPRFLQDFEKEVTAKVGKKVLIWNSPWFLAALFVLLLAEWIWRKKKGLP